MYHAHVAAAPGVDMLRLSSDASDADPQTTPVPRRAACPGARKSLSARWSMNQGTCIHEGRSRRASWRGRSDFSFGPADRESGSPATGPASATKQQRRAAGLGPLGALGLTRLLGSRSLRLPRMRSRQRSTSSGWLARTGLTRRNRVSPQGLPAKRGGIRPGRRGVAASWDRERLTAGVAARCGEQHRGAEETPARHRASPRRSATQRAPRS